MNESRQAVFTKVSVVKNTASITTIKDDIALQKYGFSVYGFTAKDIEISEEIGNLPTILHN